MATTCLLQGNASLALQWYRRADNATFRMMGEAMALHDLGDAAASDASLRALVDADAHHAAYQVASVHAWRNARDEAFEWLQRAVVQHDAGVQYVKYDPVLRGLRGDPRYAQLLRQVGLPD